MSRKMMGITAVVDATGRLPRRHLGRRPAAAPREGPGAARADRRASAAGRIRARSRPTTSLRRPSKRCGPTRSPRSSSSTPEDASGARSTCTTCSRRGSRLAARRRRRERIRVVFLDVDGVLTDGRDLPRRTRQRAQGLQHQGRPRDAQGRAAGITLCWISGRSSPATARRARELGVPLLLPGRARQARARRRAPPAARLSGAQTAAIGDDEPDIPMFEAAGFSACPADAAPAARGAATTVLEKAGGRGAVREFIELILARNGESRVVTHRPG